MGYTTYHEALEEAQAEAELLQSYNSWDEPAKPQPQEFDSDTRGAYEIAPGFTMAKLYAIVHDRLEYCIVQMPEGGNSAVRAKLSECTDIDVICQNTCAEIEKALGIYPNVRK